MTPDELYARLLLVPDATQEIIRLMGTIDYDRALAEYRPDAARDAAYIAAWSAAGKAARDAAWDAARDAAWGATQDAARDAARIVTRDAAWGATLLAGVMVVHDILEKTHRDVALSHFCWRLQFKKEK